MGMADTPNDVFDDSLGTVTFIAKKLSKRLDCNINIGRIKKKTNTAVLVIALFHIDGETCLDSFTLELDTEFFNELAAKDTLFTLVEDTYLQLIQDESDPLIDTH